MAIQLAKLKGAYVVATGRNAYKPYLEVRHSRLACLLACLEGGDQMYLLWGVFASDAGPRCSYSAGMTAIAHLLHPLQRP